MNILIYIKVEALRPNLLYNQRTGFLIDLSS